MKTREDLIFYFKELGYKTGAEIGVLEGNFSRFMCQTIPELKLYCIDSWGLGDRNSRMKDYHIRMYERAKKKLAPYNTVLIRKPSVEAVKDLKELDFVYIDANHSYASVKEDINIWTKKVKGIVSGHDYDHPPVKKAVDEYTEGKYKLELTGLDAKGRQSWWFTIPATPIILR